MKINCRFHRRSFLLATVPLTLLAAPSYAQTTAPKSAAAAADGTSVDDIVVTARRVSESLQKTPVAVTALRQETLTAKQIVQLSDLARTTPSLNFNGAGTGGALSAALSIRGQAQANPGNSNDTPVAIYVDGVYYARAQANNGTLVDMDRAEVLRGPQGTLFGRNTTGGALNLTTRAPSDRFEGYLKGGIGNYDRREGEGVVNVPLGSDLAVRFVGSYGTNEGYVSNLNTNRREANVDKQFFGRASVQWKPSSLPLTLRITGDRLFYRDNGTPAALIAAPPAATPGLGILSAFVAKPSNFYATYTGVTAAGSYVNTTFGFPAGFGASGAASIDTPQNRVVNEGVNGNLDLEVGAVHIKSITAYRYTDSLNTYDLDGSPLNLLEFQSNYLGRQFSQELQFSGTAGKLDWIGGAIYFREHGSEETTAFQFVGFSRDFTTYVSRSVGAFAQLNYHITDKLRATGGLRYTWDERSAVRHGTAGGTPAANFTDATCAVVTPAPASLAQCNDPRSGKFSYPAWLASIDYQITPETFAYIKTSGASQAGGVNFRAVPPGNEQFNPEHVKDVEFGLKADMFNRRLRTNIAAFYIWRDGLQANVSTVYAGRSTQYQINAGNVHQYGAEFEATAAPWTGMELTGAVSYLHSQFVAGTFIAPNAAGTGTIDRSGETVPQAPTWNWNVGATQTIPVSFGKFLLHLDYAHLGSYAIGQTELDPSRAAATNGFILTQAGVDAYNRLGTVASRELMNGRVAIQFAKPDIELAFWARNITKQKYYTSVFNGLYGAVGTAVANIGAPRTYGATITARW